MGNKTKFLPNSFDIETDLDFCGKALDGRSTDLLTSAALLVALSSSEVFSSSFAATSGAFSASADMVSVWFWGVLR